MEHRPGRGTIRSGAIRCDECGSAIDLMGASVRVGYRVRCLGCWYSTWNEHEHPDTGRVESWPDCPACNEARIRPHNHPTRVGTVNIGIIGCPGCIDEEAAASATQGRVGEQANEPGVRTETFLSYDSPATVELEYLPWQGYALEAWLERVDPGHDRPWIVR